MKRKVRVILWGLGNMGSIMAKALLKKEGVKIVGAIAKRKEKGGKDLGKLLNFDEELKIKVTNDAKSLFETTKADILFHCTTSFVKQAYDQIKLALEKKINVITIAEEMYNPWVKNPELAEKIDNLAKMHNVTVLGTGINPGFVLDTLILTLTGVCLEVDEIKASRINDLSPYGPTVMRTQGVGTTIEEFEKGITDGTIVGHIGFSESVSTIAKYLGWKLNEIKQTREPIISNVLRKTQHALVKPGMVAGCNHKVYGIKNGKAFITLEHPQQILPELEGIKTGDYISIKGKPEINLSIKPEIQGGIGTVAIAINMIPQVINSESGLKSMMDMQFCHAILSDFGEWYQVLT
jgi:4-hydroxy-tetrahydrodipicolinate reductase